ncbi:MAG: IMPACT family protein [Christensenellales bacterium]
MPAQLSYKTLREENSAEFIINKSRFIGYGCPCETEEEALAFLARIRQKHKDATHNCYAYIIGLNSGIMRYSDDGEPGGTAGMPIIEVMKARGVVNCAVVVTRYFGGILLGAGGLVRAYAQGSKTALDAAGVVVMEKARASWSRWIIPPGSGWNTFSAPPRSSSNTPSSARASSAR